MSDKKPTLTGALKKGIDWTRGEIAKFKNRDPEKALTRTGEPSKGLIIGKDGKVTHAMGPGHVDIQSNINEVRGGKKGLAAGLVLGGGAGGGGTYLAMKDSDKKDSKELTPFEKAFKSAKDAGKKTFTFKGKKYTTEEAIPSKPSMVRKTVEKKARGGMAVKSSSSRKSAPRGVGAAKRGYGKAMR